LKLLILFCIPIIFFTLLFNAELLPKGIYNIILVVLIVWAIISVGKRVIDASFRDRMNYDEYAWVFNKDGAPANDIGFDPNGASDPWSNSSNIVCLGSNCCYAGTTYESTLNQCIPNDVAKKMAETNAPSSSSSSSSSSDSKNGGTFGGKDFGTKFQLPQGGFGGL
jgi:hypothetical protein